MTDVQELDPRLEEFAGNPVVLATAQTLLNYYDEIVEFNDKYVTEEEPEGEYNTSWKQINWAKALADEPSEDADPEQVKEARKLVKAMDNAQSALTKARQNAANFAADSLGVSRVDEKPEVPKAEKERLQRDVRGPAVELAKNAQNLAEGIRMLDSAQADAVTNFLSKYPIPAVGRKGSLDVTSKESQAPRYRVDVVARDAEGNVLWETQGFTKAAAKKNTPNADAFREVFERNGKNETTFEHEGTTFTITPRTKGNGS